jgi:hypothetical protein
MGTQAKISQISPLAVHEKEARRLLGGISFTTLWRLRKRGLITTIQGMRTLYPVSSLQNFVEGKTGAVTAVLSPLPLTVNRKPAPSPTLERSGAR